MGANVIVVGADHQNTLGIIRACGMVGCSVSLIIHAQDKTCEVRCAKSRFLNGSLDVVSEEETELISALKTCARGKRAAVIPTSDFAALCIDSHFDELNKLFKLPSVAEEAGAIVKKMDKFIQYELLTKAGFNVAKTIKIDLKSDSYERMLDGWNYPVVIKPVISAYGDKSDIAIVDCYDEAIGKLADFSQKGYIEALVQEFINKDYELVCFGSITPQTKNVCYGTLKKIRYYPYSGGSSLSYAEYVDADEFVLPIIQYLSDIGYNGLFDIELFYVNGEIYINEINFRNSGNTWAIVKRGVNAPAAWVAEALEMEFKTLSRAKVSGSFMNETSDLHYVVDRKINIFVWLKDLMRVKAFNKFWIKDIRGSLVWFRRKKYAKN